ncbi:spike base protein, RCAP_Rcc01079 family [Neorhizobium galegae]|jgi:hypothetical protein|uniref:Uncharacterized protein n=1 Tax=Neorhizobium galegae bv. officinalis TaxID=323656 RepID=A0A0T7H1S2_NEOGA|nr:hypothetical protein [Neorhizobium galegae]CDZ53377.1 Hypothetical protein NGAL_HAMBI1189_49700 [Neorhizobium galegae bv. officinalis]
MSQATEGMARTNVDCGYQHWLIEPSDTDDLPTAARAIWCQSAGTIVVRDETGNDLPYDLATGQILPFYVVRVLATGTTGTFYGWT